jgi:predicted transcriptional regulator
MIKALEDAIEKARSLPPERQADAADALERIIKASRTIYVLSAEEHDLIEEGIADADAGRIATDAEMEAFWARHSRRKT